MGGGTWYMDCVFCKIADGRIKSEKIYDSEKIMVFKDLDPKAPVHLLFVPKEHIESLNKINSENICIVSEIFKKIPEIVKKFGISDGYRVVNNCGFDAGQSVNHLHFHVLGGRHMHWPPG
jgi:histidine triad (HIT) family protein